MHLAGLEHTLVFYVPPHDLLAVLKDAAEVLGESRQCVVARELTKVGSVQYDVHGSHVQCMSLLTLVNHKKL